MLKSDRRWMIFLRVTVGWLEVFWWINKRHSESIHFILETSFSVYVVGEAREKDVTWNVAPSITAFPMPALCIDQPLVSSDSLWNTWYLTFKCVLSSMRGKVLVDVGRQFHRVDFEISKIGATSIILRRRHFRATNGLFEASESTWKLSFVFNLFVNLTGKLSSRCAAGSRLFPFMRSAPLFSSRKCTQTPSIQTTWFCKEAVKRLRSDCCKKSGDSLVTASSEFVSRVIDHWPVWRSGNLRREVLRKHDR